MKLPLVDRVLHLRGFLLPGTALGITMVLEMKRSTSWIPSVPGWLDLDASRSILAHLSMLGYS